MTMQLLNRSSYIHLDTLSFITYSCYYVNTKNNSTIDFLTMIIDVQLASYVKSITDGYNVTLLAYAEMTTDARYNN